MSVLAYLHDKNQAHRDLKAEDIIITKANLLKLFDLGLAKEGMASKIYANSKVGTLVYMAPELCNPITSEELGSVASYKADLWSLGVLI